MADVTIYHNPSCSTSKNVLAMADDAGVDVDVIQYLKTPPTSSRSDETGRPLRHRSDAKTEELGLSTRGGRVGRAPDATTSAR